MRPDRDPAIATHIESVSARSVLDTDRLMAAMLARSWPGGAVDRTDAMALEWVRRWGPRTAGVTPVACTCARGHCALCN